MRKALALSITVLGIASVVQAAPKPAVITEQCRGCHAMPPGSGADNGRFKPGAHGEHAALDCGQCHPPSNTEAHINGVISLKAELEYQYGSEVPWPSLGSGSCGGRGYPFRPPGCHEQMPEAKCFWVPGKNCLPSPRP